MNFVIFNPEKHHIYAIASKIVEYSRRSEEALPIFLEELVHKGIHRTSMNDDCSYNGIVDVYLGNLQVEEMKKEVADFLEKNNASDLASYKAFIEAQGKIKRRGHYTSVELSDKTVMTLRMVEDEKGFAHIHPGRYSPNTIRIKANTLKTAILTKFLSLCRNKLYDLDLINEARGKLGLSPVTENIDAIYGMLQILDEWSAKVK